MGYCRRNRKRKGGIKLMDGSEAVKLRRQEARINGETGRGMKMPRPGLRIGGFLCQTVWAGFLKDQPDLIFLMQKGCGDVIVFQYISVHNKLFRAGFSVIRIFYKDMQVFSAEILFYL